MKPAGITDKSLSLSTHHLRMKFSETDTILATGTGFIYEYDNWYYLITNGHNITGVDPETKKRVSNHAGIPDVISTKCRIEPETNKDVLVVSELFAIDLYQDRDFEKPLWFIHPTFGYHVDVVAIPVNQVSTLPSHIKLFPINKMLEDWQFYPEVGDDVFVLGYPLNLSGGKELPVWKRGSVATETYIDLDNLPKYLIDTATRSGMSGSPVIFQRTGIHNYFTGTITGKEIIGTIKGFAGVYSGRIGVVDNFQAQLGIVWKREVIEEILAAKVVGTTEFQHYG